jgi:DNA invertase Pin-like site-specific DNA recombinase
VNSVIASGKPEPAVASDLTPAAEYVRKSTDQQRYSTENQSDANRAYAARHQMQIVRTYADQGISGLTFYRRDALQQLIKDIQTGNTNFKVILVYDVSRWGRPQDPDEAAHYEYICKSAGFAVHYCAEDFDNDGSLFSSIVKNLKRAMAAEYSRELSVKIFTAQRRIIQMGFGHGGIAAYGLRRVLVDENGTFKCILSPGMHKAITRDRVKLVPGPVEEVDLVRWMYGEFVHRGKSEIDIARVLNERGVPNHLGRPWTYMTIRNLLKNEKYIGNLVWNRKSYKLRQKLILNSCESWVRVEHALEPIIDRQLFEAAQTVFRNRPLRTCRGRPAGLSDREMLNCLTGVLRDHGRLTRHIIDKSANVPSTWVYTKRFGSMARVYELLGLNRKDANKLPATIIDQNGNRRWLRDEDMLDLLKQLVKKHGYLSKTIIDNSPGVPSSQAYQKHFGGLLRAYKLIGYVPPYCARPRMSDEQMLGALKQLLRERGTLSRTVIQEYDTLPSRYTYSRRFGGLMSAYKRIGFIPPDLNRRQAVRGLSKHEMLEMLAKLLEKSGYLSQRLIDRSTGLPCRTTYAKRFGSLRRAYELIGYRHRRSRPEGSAATGRRYTKRELLDFLRKLLKKEGRISSHLLNRTKGYPTATTFRRRFGSYSRACKLIGYQVPYRPTKA